VADPLARARASLEGLSVGDAFGERFFVHPELVERLIRHELAHPVDPAALSALVAAGAGYSGQLRQARIKARTLVVHGEDDTVVDPRNGKLLAERIPQAELVTVAGQGHLLFWEDPRGFGQLVCSFLLA